MTSFGNFNSILKLIFSLLYWFVLRPTLRICILCDCHCASFYIFPFSRKPLNFGFTIYCMHYVYNLHTACCLWFKQKTISHYFRHFSHDKTLNSNEVFLVCRRKNSHLFWAKFDNKILQISRYTVIFLIVESKIVLLIVENFTCYFVS